MGKHKLVKRSTLTSTRCECHDSCTYVKVYNKKTADSLRQLTMDELSDGDIDSNDDIDYSMDTRTGTGRNGNSTGRNSISNGNSTGTGRNSDYSSDYSNDYSSDYSSSIDENCNVIDYDTSVCRTTINSNGSSDSYDDKDSYECSIDDYSDMDDDSDIINLSDECDSIDDDYESSCDIEDCGCETPVCITVKIINTRGKKKDDITGGLLLSSGKTVASGVKTVAGSGVKTVAGMRSITSGRSVIA